MTEDEFKETAVGKAMIGFLTYMPSLVALMNQIDTGRAFLLGGVNWLAKLVKQDSVDTARHDAFLHALYVIGSWSSFEAFFDDFCVAILRSEPATLDAERLNGVKVPITDLLTSEDEKPERVYLALKEKTERKPGVTKFEDILKCIRLGGPIPDDLSKAVYESQQIRHVWAHKAGIADNKFVEAAGYLGFGPGDLVAISNEQARTYCLALFIYGMIIVNRWRTRVELPPLMAQGKDPEKTPFKDLLEGGFDAPAP